MLLQIGSLQVLVCLLNIKGAIATIGQENQTGYPDNEVILNCLDISETKSNLTSPSIDWRVKNKTSHSYETMASMRNGRTRLFKNGTALEGRLTVLSNGSLKISSLRPDDETSYQCIVKGGSGGPYEKTINLQVKFYVCGGVLIDPIGGFQSPNFPSSYPANTHCQWNISIEQEYAAIDITFDRFDLEHEDNCRHDHIVIFDEIGNQIGCRRCGNYKSPVDVQIKGRKVVIEFHSNGSVNKSGFKSSYKGALSVDNLYP